MSYFDDIVGAFLYGSKQDVDLAVTGNLPKPTNAQDCVTKVTLDSACLSSGGNLTLKVLKGRPEDSSSTDGPVSFDYSRSNIADNGNIN